MPIDQTRIWEDATSPHCDALVRRFVVDWRKGKSSHPDLANYLPEDPCARPPALLALLRADLTLRHESGDFVRIESYLRRFPALPSDLVTALVYEEYCVRQDAGESLDPREFDIRFPAIAAEIRDLIDIHNFVDSSQDLLLGEESARDDVEFPSAGETISGFRLVEELGRGRLARVFLALERHLADRPVALKVSRRGSREPQTLAILQHTHIVPIYSYQVDVVTGLHLVCMPFFGRVTLADILGEPKTRAAKTGADLLAVLDELGSSGRSRPRAEGREALRERSFAQAIAWWGARLAEALQYAHDCGVLHHDIKPSNVLVTDDARPMLLDFNLARPSGGSGQVRGDIGGTLAYMAPEHLAAVVDSNDDTAVGRAPVDGRADVYSLGVVLHEALGHRPYGQTEPGGSAAGGLGALFPARTAPVFQRRPGGDGRKIPAALEAVIKRCLQPDPADRYALAAELAADLRAVADDGPLRFAREPEPSRTLRCLWRNRRIIASALGMLALAGIFVAMHTAALRREALARGDLEAGIRSAAAGEFAAAAAQFARAVDRASTGGSQALRQLAAEAERKKQDALAAGRVRDRAQAFFAKVEPIRYRLMTGYGLDSASTQLRDAFADFQVFGPKPWTSDPELDRLGPLQRERLFDEVNEVLFLWVIAADSPGDQAQARRAAAICELALLFSRPRGPWSVLKSRYDGSEPDPGSMSARPGAESNARACVEWGFLALLEGRPDQALAWFDRAVSLSPDRFWYQFALAYHHSLHGDAAHAVAHYNAALALRPASSWVLFNRGQLGWSRLGTWERALADLDRVRANPGGLDPDLLALELGRVAERLGDFPTALEYYQGLIAVDSGSELARRARLYRARVELELGPAGRDRAWRDYERLVALDPADSATRLGHAVVALRIGEPDVAETDLTRLLTDHPDESANRAARAEWLATRAIVRLALRRSTEAACDATEAVRLSPSPGRLRVRLRLAIATGCESDLNGLDPDDVDRLPAGGRSLTVDLQSAADKLRLAIQKEEDGSEGTVGLSSRITRAALLSALGDHREALLEAEAAVRLQPFAVEARLLRARIRRRAGDSAGAMADLDAGLALAPADARLQTMRGRLLIDAGEPLAGLDALDRALAAGAGKSAHAERARALRKLDRCQESIAEWTLALRDDPEDADAFLGRASCFARLGRWDPALADLESAVNWSLDRPGVLVRSALIYASCLAGRPNRLSRVFGLALRALGVRARC